MVRGVVAIFMLLMIAGIALTSLIYASEDGITSNNVRFSLYTKCGCKDGAPLPGVIVTGQDASSTPFDVTTDTNGYASIEGSPGTWQFTASKDGYVTSSWTMPVFETDTKYPYLLNDNTAWKYKAGTTGTLSNEELARLVAAVFPEGDVPGKSGESIRATAYAVAKAESYGGNPTAWGDEGLGDSLGLWQVNLCQHPEYKGHELDLFEPEYNAKAALEISKGGTYWTPWTTWKYPKKAPAYKKYLKEAQDELNKLSGIKPVVTLTLYVHDESVSGPIIPGAQVSGQDGSGNGFLQTTDLSGYVTIEGDPGTWSFSASADGYETNNWDLEITESDVKHAFLQKNKPNRISGSKFADYESILNSSGWDEKWARKGSGLKGRPTYYQTPVTLTLYVHDGSESGPIISSAQVTGQDGAGNSFLQTTNSNGYVTIKGDAGTWSFTASAEGYDANSWSQPITETCVKHAFLRLSPSESFEIGREERCGDGIDNDGDDDIDEGCDYALYVEDNQCKDDIIGIEIDGIYLGETPAGMGRYFDISYLDSGYHELVIIPVDSGGEAYGCDPTSIITYGITLTNVEFLSKDGSEFDGTTDSGKISVGDSISYEIYIP